MRQDCFFIKYSRTAENRTLRRDMAVRSYKSALLRFSKVMVGQDW